VQNWKSGFGHIDDTVVRHWALEAREGGQGFRVLKLLVLRNQPQITFGVLKYLAELPALRVFHLTGPTLTGEDARDVIVQTDWRWMNESSLCLRLYQMWFAAKSHQTILKELYSKILREDDAAAGKLEKNANPQSMKRPLLGALIGKPHFSGIASRQDQLWFELPFERKETCVMEEKSTDSVKPKVNSKRQVHPWRRDDMASMLNDLAAGK